MVNQGIKVTGTVVIRDNNKKMPDGKSEVIYIKKNLVVNLGLQWFVKSLDGDNPQLFQWIAVGDNNTAASAIDVQLVSEIERQPVTLTIKDGNSWKAQAEFPAGVGTGNWYEAGLFDDDTSGTMFNRVILALTKGAGDNWTLEFTITFTNV